jgi:RNA polymerase sigma-70 factor, ECF subfamily
MARATEYDDRALVARMLEGDEAAFEAFFQGCFTRLFAFCLPRVGRDPDAAEEVVQAVLGRAVRKLGTYRGEAPLFSWLCTFCRREIAARRPRREVELEEERPEVRAALEAQTPGFRPEDAIDRAEAGRLVRMALDTLPLRYGQALEWKYLEGRSVVEVAERLSLGPKAAESLLTRARVAFRTTFDSLGGRAYWPVAEPD